MELLSTRKTEITLLEFKEMSDNELLDLYIYAHLNNTTISKVNLGNIIFMFEFRFKSELTLVECDNLLYSNINNAELITLLNNEITNYSKVSGELRNELLYRMENARKVRQDSLSKALDSFTNG